jgi:hypothetical protein
LEVLNDSVTPLNHHHLDSRSVRLSDSGSKSSVSNKEQKVRLADSSKMATKSSGMSMGAKSDLVERLKKQQSSMNIIPRSKMQVEHQNRILSGQV